MQNSSNRLGIEFISVFAMPPIEFVHLAADLNCHHIGLALAPFTANPYGFAAWSLREDKALRQATIAALRARDVSISLGEGFLVHPGVEARNYAADLDIMRELGAARVNVLCIDPDRARTYDQLAVFVALARERGLEIVLEFMPNMVIGNLASALAALDHVGEPSFRLLIDMMHLMRSGGSPEQLAAIDPNRIGYIQLCDAPLVAINPDYGAEARDNRLAPGEGQLPLVEIFAAAPDHLVVGLETPMLDKAKSGVSPRELLSGPLATSRALLDQAAKLKHS